MKKLISLLLAAVLCLSFVACSPQSSSRPSGEETTTSSPSGNETTAPDHSGDETTSPDHSDGETTAPNNSDDETTSPDHSDDETTTPDHSDGETNAPDHSDGETTAPDHSDDETKAPDSSDGETKAPDSSDGETNDEIPDGFFVEDEEDYVSNTIIQSGKDQPSKNDEDNARLTPNGVNATDNLSEKMIGLQKKGESACSVNSRRHLASASVVTILSSSESESTTTEETSTAGETEENTTEETEDYTEITTSQIETDDSDIIIEESTIDPDLNTTIKGYEYELEDCYVSGYIGNDLFIIQDFGSLAWNKKGIGHRDGTYIWSFGEDKGFFSISSMNENMIIVGNPTDENVESLWDDTSSYLFGYLVYDEETKTLTPLYETNNLRFYTATYFIDGYAIVSVEDNGEILFGVINTKGEYVIEPGYQMIHDETNNGIAISAKETTMLDNPYGHITSPIGRDIVYSNTLFTNVQHIRRFAYTSSTVGLIDVKTGEEILPCEYSYVEYLGKTEYFVVDAEGKSYLFDSSNCQLVNCQVDYAYFAKGWTLLRTAENTIHLRNNDGRIYSTADLYCVIDEYSQNTLYDYFRNHDSLIMTNILSSEREEQSLKYRTAPVENFNGAIEGDGSSYKIWNKAHDQFIEVDSVAVGYGKILFTKDNYVYRLDYDTFESTRLEIGFGGFADLNGFTSDDYASFEGVEFKMYIELMGDGIYNVRVEQRFAEGSSWFDIIINEYGEVILDVAINSAYRFDTNYLGLYDKALYELAGNTDMKDNYFIIRNDGHTCVLQFVRKNVADRDTSEDENAVIQYPDRTISNDGSSIYTSPFIFNFEDPSSIEVTFEGNVVDTKYYYYDPDTQALKFHPYYLDSILYQESTIEVGKFSFVVKAGNEVATISFIVKMYNYN